MSGLIGLPKNNWYAYLSLPDVHSSIVPSLNHEIDFLLPAFSSLAGIKDSIVVVIIKLDSVKIDAFSFIRLISLKMWFVNLDFLDSNLKIQRGPVFFVNMVFSRFCAAQTNPKS